MSLATRCPSCGTIFRVVQDQLKVCEGWVRCGRCDEVFSALEGLFDLERDAPPEWSPGTQVPGMARGLPADQPAAAEANIAATRPLAAIDGPPDPMPAAGSAAADSTLPFDAEPSTLAQAHETSSFAMATESDEVAAAGAFGTSAVAGARADALADAEADSTEPTPGFLRRAQRQARWQRPAVRAALGVAAFALLAVLAGQAAHHFRDQVAARWPASRPLLTAWCASAGCMIGTPRHIEAISVESSALNRAAAPDSFKLALALRNRSAVALAMPAIELTLTDAAGQMVARRALLPRDFRVAAPVLAPGAETPLQLVLSAGNGRVTGYTVELFYP
jgi:predicted Zn finger-like uncharacterized protein